MKLFTKVTSNHAMKRWLAALLYVASAVGVLAQETPPDPAWKTRLAALQEEHDAQAGTAVFIVFDDSGSMNDDNKLVMAKKSFRAWVEHAPDAYRFSLTTLNEGTPVSLARNNRRQLLAAVDRLRAAGQTPLADTIARVRDAIVQSRAQGALYVRQVVVILTDGEDNSPRGDQGVREEMNRLRAEGVEVIAFGYKGEADYLNGTATHFYSPNNGQDISKGLNAIDSEVRDTSDVVVDDATRKVMQTLPVAASMQSAPVVGTTNAPPAPVASSPKKSGGVGWGLIITLGVVVMIARSALGGKRGR